MPCAVDGAPGSARCGAEEKRDDDAHDHQGNGYRNGENGAGGRARGSLRNPLRASRTRATKRRRLGEGSALRNEGLIADRRPIGGVGL